MAAAAEFTINNDPFANLGFDTTTSAVLTLKLANTPALDSATVKFSVAAKTKNAPDLVFSPSDGVPETPTGEVMVTMPGSGFHSYKIRCVVNYGVDASGLINRDYTKDRIVAIRSATIGLRKWIPAETTEYDAEGGWVYEQNDAAEEMENAALPGTVVTQVTGAAPIASSGGTTPQISISPASALNAGSMSATHFTLVAGATENATNNTLARRTSAGGLRMNRIELGSSFASSGDICLPSNFNVFAASALGDADILAFSLNDLFIGGNRCFTKIWTRANDVIEFLQGVSADRFIRFQSTGACTEERDFRIASDGRPRVYVAADAAERTLITAHDAIFQEKHTKAADSASTDPTALTSFSGPMQKAAALVAVHYIAAATLTADDTNYAQIDVFAIDAAGASGSAIATVTTQVTGGSGNWSVRVPVTIPIVGGGSIPLGHHLGFSISKPGGTGVIVPAGILVAQYRYVIP